MSNNVSLSQAINSASSGIRTSATAIKTTIDNITNTATEGYSRRIHKQETMATGGNTAGVRALTAMRAVQPEILKRVGMQMNDFHYKETGDKYFNQVESLMGELGTESSLHQRMQGLSATLIAASNAPNSVIQRAELLNQSTKVCHTLNTTATSIQNIRLEADKEILSSIETLNDHLSKLYELNKQITLGTMQNADISTLEDARDGLVKSISEYINIVTNTDKTGQTHIRTESGVELVGYTLNTVSYSPLTRAGVEVIAGENINDIKASGTSIQKAIKGGKLGALLHMRDEYLPTIQERLDNVAKNLQRVMNKAHNEGCGFPAAKTLTGTTEIAAVDQATAIAWAAGSKVRVALVDNDGKLIRHSDIDLSGKSAEDIRIALNAIDDLEATWDKDTLKLKATNGARIAIGTIDGETKPTVNINGDEVGFSEYFGLNNMFTAYPSQTANGPKGYAQSISVREDIAENTSLFAFAKLNSSAILQAGEDAVSPFDSRNAQRLVEDFISQKHEFPAGGNIESQYSTLSEYVGTVTAKFSLEASLHQKDLDASKELLQALEAREASATGVNHEEEAHQLMLHMSVSRASSTAFKQIKDLIDELISSMGR